MKDALSIYAFTLLTPQLALEVILLVALFLVTTSLSELRESGRSLVLFTATFAVLVLYLY